MTDSEFERPHDQRPCREDAPGTPAHSPAQLVSVGQPHHQRLETQIAQQAGLQGSQVAALDRILSHGRLIAPPLPRGIAAGLGALAQQLLVMHLWDRTVTGEGNAGEQQQCSQSVPRSACACICMQAASRLPLRHCFCVSICRGPRGAQACCRSHPPAPAGRRLPRFGAGSAPAAPAPEEEEVAGHGGLKGCLPCVKGHVAAVQLLAGGRHQLAKTSLLTTPHSGAPQRLRRRQHAAPPGGRSTPATGRRLPRRPAKRSRAGGFARAQLVFRSIAFSATALPDTAEAGSPCGVYDACTFPALPPPCWHTHLQQLLPKAPELRGGVQ